MTLADRGLSTTALVLAAGLGTRMRPITDTIPKPLVPVGGRTMLDFVIDRFADVGVRRVVVNVHHLADVMEAHLRHRTHPAVIVSDERAGLLDSGGGAKKMLPHVDAPAFLLANADTIWIEGARPNMVRLIERFDAARMDILLLLAAASASIGFEGRGDFAFEPDGRLRRRGEREVVPFAYAGVAIFRTALFDNAPEGPFSLNRLFDRAASEGRLYGERMDGVWMHVGTPRALEDAERALQRTPA